MTLDEEDRMAMGMIFSTMETGRSFDWEKREWMEPGSA